MKVRSQLIAEYLPIYKNYFVNEWDFRTVLFVEGFLFNYISSSPKIKDPLLSASH